KPRIKLQNRNRAAGLGLPGHAEAGEKELGAQKCPEMLNGLSTHQVTHLVTGRQPVHAENLSQVFRYIIGAAKARHFRIVSPPHVTKADQKIPQRRLALRWALLAGLRLPGVQRTHRQNAIGLLANAHCRQRSASTYVINEMAPRPCDVVVGQGAVAGYTDTE